MTYPPQYGADQPQYGANQPQYGAQQPQYGGYQPQPPQKKRGMKRIVFGILGLVANGIGLFVMPFVAAIVVAMIALASASPVSLGGTSGTIDATASSMYYVYVPTPEAASATCTAEGSGESIWTAQETGVPATIDGTEYSPVGTVSVTTDQQVTVTCQGASDVAVAEVGLVGTLVGLGVGVLVPVLLGLVALGLLIWGIVARVRS